MKGQRSKQLLRRDGASLIHYNIQSYLLNLKIFKEMLSNYNEHHVLIQKKSTITNEYGM